MVLIRPTVFRIRQIPYDATGGNGYPVPTTPAAIAGEDDGLVKI